MAKLRQHHDRLRDKSISQNNMALPFLVTAMEAFLRDFFISYLEELPSILEKYYSKKKQTWTHEQLLSITAGRATLAKLEAENWSFQKLRLTDDAYNAVLELPLLSVLETFKKQTSKRVPGKKVPPIKINIRRKHAGKMLDIRKTIEEMIGLRHSIIHEAFIDTNLSKERMWAYVFAVETFLSLFASKLEAKPHSFKMDLEEYSV